MKRTLRSLPLLAAVALVLVLAGSVQAAPKESPAGPEIELFTGKNLDGWHGFEGQDNKWVVAGKVAPAESDPAKFKIEEGEGILVNGPEGRTTNLLSDFNHGDCALHIEFMVPKGSNSGVYFHGQYEIQVFDSFGKEKVDSSDCGGVYARYKNDKTYEGTAPRVNASLAQGEWQTFDITFRAPRFEGGKKVENARFLKVVHNGKVVHENVEVTGPTRAALEESHKVEEKATGPLMLQGDHGPVAYRNIVMKPLTIE